MKILQINSCHYRRGGADVVYLNTTELLQQYGHEVYCFSMQYEQNQPSEYAEYFAKNNDVRDASFTQKLKSLPSFIYNKDAAGKLEALLDTVKPDIAHIHIFLGKLSSSILKVLKDRKIPVVLSVHDYRLLCPAYLFLDGNNKVCEKCKDGFYLHCATKRCSEGNFLQSLLLSADAYYRKYRIKPLDYIGKFLFVSDFIRRKHIEFDSAYQGKEAMLYNFIPQLEKVVPVHTKGNYFLFYGRLSREKGVDTLVDAAEKAGIPLKIVGTGSLSEKYKLKNYKGIEFLGHKTGNELWELVKNASFIVVPSEWYENNPLTVLEAYGFGKPVIGARIGGIPEIVEDGKTGYLFESGNEVELLARLQTANQLTEEEYVAMSVNARKFAEQHFEPHAHYQNLIEIYNGLLAQS